MERLLANKVINVFLFDKIDAFSIRKLSAGILGFTGIIVGLGGSVSHIDANLFISVWLRCLRMCFGMYFSDIMIC